MSFRNTTLAMRLARQPVVEHQSPYLQQSLLVALDALCPDDVLCVAIGTNTVLLENFSDEPRHPEHWRILLIEQDRHRAEETAALHAGDPRLDIVEPAVGLVGEKPVWDILVDLEHHHVDLFYLDAVTNSLLMMHGLDLNALNTRLVVATGGDGKPETDIFIEEMSHSGFEVFSVDGDLICVNRSNFPTQVSLMLGLMGYHSKNPVFPAVNESVDAELAPARPIDHGPLAIPRSMAHIWVGDRPAPVHWMQSWRDQHPDWEYRVYDNAFLSGRRWRNQALIAEYFARRLFHGVSDLMRYELLLERGGVIPEADSVCLKPVDDLFPNPTLYCVYENEEHRPGYISHFVAAAPGQAMLKDILKDLEIQQSATSLQAPWISTGNRYIGQFVAGREDEVVIFPSHYFNPNFKSRLPYDGDGPVYADQKWGSTLRLYGSYPADKAARIFEEVLDAL